MSLVSTFDSYVSRRKALNKTVEENIDRTGNITIQNLLLAHAVPCSVLSPNVYKFQKTVPQEGRNLWVISSYHLTRCDDYNAENTLHMLRSTNIGNYLSRIAGNSEYDPIHKKVDNKNFRIGIHMHDQKCGFIFLPGIIDCIIINECKFIKGGMMTPEGIKMMRQKLQILAYIFHSCGYKNIIMPLPGINILNFMISPETEGFQDHLVNTYWELFSQIGGCKFIFIDTGKQSEYVNKFEKKFTTK